MSQTEAEVNEVALAATWSPADIQTVPDDYDLIDPEVQKSLAITLLKNSADGMINAIQRAVTKAEEGEWGITGGSLLRIAVLVHDLGEQALQVAVQYDPRMKEANDKFREYARINALPGESTEQAVMRLTAQEARRRQTGARDEGAFGPTPPPARSSTGYL